MKLTKREKGNIENALVRIINQHTNGIDTRTPGHSVIA